MSKKYHTVYTTADFRVISRYLARLNVDEFLLNFPLICRLSKKCANCAIYKKLYTMKPKNSRKRVDRLHKIRPLYLSDTKISKHILPKGGIVYRREYGVVEG